MSIRDCALDDVGRGSTRARVPGCLRYDLGTCTGPCIGEGDPDSYRARASDVRAFLEGRSSVPVDVLERAMASAARDLAFERAAMLRDRLLLVRWLHDHVTNFHANMDRLTFRYHATGTEGREWVYLIRRGTVRAEVPSPTTPEEHGALEATAARVFEGPDPAGRDIPTHDLDELYLVSSWFRRRKDAKERVRPALPTRSAVPASMPS
jgi:excinuclease ABC subunit C